MSGAGFFSEVRENSVVKTKIVSKYFWVWAKIISGKTPTDRIAYIDLFAGPGRYEDGTKSTPLLVLEQAIKDEKFRNKLVVLLNDADANHAASLKTDVAALPGVDTLKYPPRIDNRIVGEELANWLHGTNLVPTFCFIDPWGYKGLSLRLINAVVKDFACECVFFFNYNRINMGLTNAVVDAHIRALFGDERTERMRATLASGVLKPEDREVFVLENLTGALIEMGNGRERFILPFRFRSEDGRRTSHYLIFVSKHRLGYGIMKEIMADESSKHEQGVPTFEYCAADARFPLLFELNRPLSELEDLLPLEFAGQTIKAKQIYERHHVGRRYIWENYQSALRNLEAQGKITIEPPASKRQKRKGIVTVAEHLTVTFPGSR